MRWIVLCLLLVSCSSKYTDPPSSEYIKSLYEGTHYPELNKVEENERQAAVFIQARSLGRVGKNTHACQRHHYLSRDESFPLQKLVNVKKLKYCKADKSKLESALKNYKKEFPNYLREEALNYILYQAQLKNYHEIIVESSLALVSYKKTRKEKNDLYKTALKSAKKIKKQDLINKALSQREATFSRYLRKVKAKDFYKVARDFEKNRQFKKARKYYLKAINRKSLNMSSRIKSYYRYAFTFKLQRDKDTYTAKMKNMVWWLKSLWKKSPNSEELKNAYIKYSIVFARATWTQQNLKEGRYRLTTLLKRVKDIPESYLEEIYFVLGKMALEQKKIKLAQSWFEKGINLKEKREDYKERFYWALAWSHYLKKNYKESRTFLYRGIEDLESVYTQRKFKFWVAKTFEKDNMPSEAQHYWKELWEEDPYGYYGIIAKIEIDGDFPEIDSDIEEFDPPNKELHWLLALDEYDYAKKYLEKNKSIHKDLSKTESLELLFHSGWFEGALFFFFKLKSEERDKLLEDLSPIIFPSPYKEKLSFVSAKEKVSLELIYSIMRQESAFNPTIRSWADAFGLMQVTPERANELSKRYKIPYDDFSDLYSPEKNVQFGSKILQELIKKNKQNFIKYVASYNASKSVVSRWFRTKFRKDPVEFIEMIPYEETKGYVKLVFRNFVTYNRLHKGEFKISKDFLYSGKITD